VFRQDFLWAKTHPKVRIKSNSQRGIQRIRKEAVAFGSRITMYTMLPEDTGPVLVSPIFYSPFRSNHVNETAHKVIHH